MRYLYVIGLDSKKFYVGSTVSKKRINDQLLQNKRASQWIRVNKIDRLIGCWILDEVIEYRLGEIVESEVTLGLMKVVGFLQVRGGFFTLIDGESIKKTLFSHKKNNRFKLKELAGLSLDNSIQSDLADSSIDKIVENILVDLDVSFVKVL